MVTRRTALTGVTGLLTLSTAGCLADLGIDSDEGSENETNDAGEPNETDDASNESESPDDEEQDDEEQDDESDDEHEQVDGAYELTVAEIEEGDWIGERVRVEGTVTDVVGGDTVDRFALEDDTGELRMVYPAESRDDFGTGDAVRVEGVVTDGEDVPSTPPVIEEAEVYYL